MVGMTYAKRGLPPSKKKRPQNYVSLPVNKKTGNYIINSGYCKVVYVLQSLSLEKGTMQLRCNSLVQLAIRYSCGFCVAY